MSTKEHLNAQGWRLQNTYADLPEIFFSAVKPTPVAQPQLVVFNRPLGEQLGLSTKNLTDSEAAELFSGNKMIPGSKPLAQAYAGHQFGHFARLGDGRAILLGEQITPSGEKYDVQLKGSGPTPYARRGDGRAALKPMLREYIISEAMHALGIPTTRSLAVVATGEPVMRETVLPGAVLTRIAKSHIRVGTFEFARRFGEFSDLNTLAHYALPELNAGLTLLKDVIEKQAMLVARWMHVGFIHGVMNTDNMTISGETIDYGPCAFLDAYDPLKVFSSIDSEGRYAYSNQPRMALWNLERFAEALLPLLDEDENTAVDLAQDALESFANKYNEFWLQGMRAKLGLFDAARDEDTQLITELLKLMHKMNADYTNTFRGLTHFLNGFPASDLFHSSEFKQWNEAWTLRRNQQEASAADIALQMRHRNPSVIPRNHRVEEALTAAAERGDLSVMERLLAVLAKPFDDSEEHARYSEPGGPAFANYRTFCGT